MINASANITKKTADMQLKYAGFKESLNDPVKLVTIMKDTVFKWRFEAHIDIFCLPRGKESPNHDYAILFHDQTSSAGLELEAMQAIIKNFMENSRLPLKISCSKAKKDGIIYNAIFLDVQEKIEVKD